MGFPASAQLRLRKQSDWNNKIPDVHYQRFQKSVCKPNNRKTVRNHTGLLMASLKRRQTARRKMIISGHLIYSWLRNTFAQDSMAKPRFVRPYLHQKPLRHTKYSSLLEYNYNVCRMCMEREKTNKNGQVTCVVHITGSLGM